MAIPVSHPFKVRFSSLRRLPADLCIAPSTPPPPRSELLAAFTMPSNSSFVMSPRNMEILSANPTLLTRSGFSVWNAFKSFSDTGT